MGFDLFKTPFIALRIKEDSRLNEGYETFTALMMYEEGRMQMSLIDNLCNSSRSMVDLATEQCSTILNWSRDYMFVNLCIGIVESQGLNLRRKINLSKG